jgi:hypothetical protein
VAALAPLLGLLAHAPALAAPATDADYELLAAADLHAAAPAAFRARLRLEPLQPGRPAAELELWRDGERSLLRFLDERNRGKAFLQDPDGAWFLSASARPVKLAPGHRFAAGLSLQDLLGFAYSRHFRIEGVERRGSGATEQASFDLRALDPAAPYPQVTYVVAVVPRRPLRVELRLASGRVARLLELSAWTPGRRLSPAEMVVKDLVGGQPPVRVRFLELEERQPPTDLFALGPAGDRARAALPAT